MDSTRGRHAQSQSSLPARLERSHTALAPARQIELTQAPQPGGAEAGGLLEYGRILRRRKGTLILVAFLGALAGFLITVPQTPIYQARSTLEVQGLNENFLNMREVSPTVTASNIYYPEYDLQTQVRILQSATLRQRVLAKLRSENRNWPAGSTSRLSAWRKALGLPPAKEVSAGEAALAMAAGTLRVRAQANTRLLEISADSTDPQLAADFVNALAGEYTEQNLEARWKTTQHTGEWLTRQMEELRIKLEKSEEGLQNYARASGLQFTSEKDNVAEQKLKGLQEELSKAQADRIAKQSRYELAAAASPESLAEVLDDASLREHQARLRELRQQRAELTTSFTAAHPKVQKIEAQITTLEAELGKARATIVRRIQNDFEAAERREKLLAATYAAQARLMAEQADKVTHYNILKREVDTNRQLYENMLQRVKEAGIASALRASNIRVVDPAQRPAGPYKPNVSTNTMLGLLTGLLLGVVLVVGLERMDRTVQSPGDVSFYLNASELGVIPSAHAELGRRLYRSSRQEVAAGGSLGQALQKSEMAIELATWQRKPSLVAESFRATLTSILFSGQNGDRPRVIVLTSPNPGEGKSTVVSNLGIALAEINQRVLLIDADLRKPRLRSIFCLTAPSGLSDLLRQKQPLNGGPVEGLVSETEVPGLFVLPSGSESAASTNLLYSPRMGELLQLLRHHFDTILIDTPPMLHIPDARVLGRLADAVILVVRANRTTRDATRAAYQRLAEDGTPVLGTILNDWNPKRTPGYGYYRYYDRYYRRYYGSKRES